MREQLTRSGLQELSNGKKTDCCIINTCTVTTSADRQSRYLIRLAKRENPNARVIVTGCYAHSNAAELEKIDEVDLVLNNYKKERIAEFLNPRNRTNIHLPFEISDFKSRTRAFVKIQDGCDNLCSFCKVPYVRGRSRSRIIDEIVDEVKRLSDNGYKEIVLTGICLGDYGKEFSGKTDLVDLIDEIEKIEGILRIRLSSIEAKDVTDKLIKKMAKSSKLCPHLHIPFQSGDDKILKHMNRRDTRQTYLKLVKKLKKNIKGMAISTDIMICFPGENKEEFNNTLDFLKEIVPSRVHIFTFQPRDKTPMSNCKSLIPRKIIKERYEQLKVLSDNLSFYFRKRFINKGLGVLFERKKDSYWCGYSENYLLTYLKSNVKLLLDNKLRKIIVKKVDTSILYSELEVG
jgi:threonylcarbamoyladenosine tRNA methylthiotransferase MtaB